MDAILAWLKRAAIGGVAVVRLPIGYATFLRTGRTPGYALRKLLALFCLTRGWSNDILAKIISWFRPTYAFPPSANAIGPVACQDTKRVVADLRDLGYHVVGSRLSADMCDRLLAFATKTRCEARPMDGEDLPGVAVSEYPRSSPQAVRYDFSTEDLLANPDVQALLADTSLIAIAQEYLGTAPMIDVLTMWWHTAYSERPDSRAAQYFHFDMDRVKWLKVFIMLTDVGPENGPHMFVARSQQTGGIPKALLADGVRRLADGEVAAHYPGADIIEFHAPRGTVLVEDTRGWDPLESTCRHASLSIL